MKSLLLAAAAAATSALMALPAVAAAAAGRGTASGRAAAARALGAGVARLALDGAGHPGRVGAAHPGDARCGPREHRRLGRLLPRRQLPLPRLDQPAHRLGAVG